MTAWSVYWAGLVLATLSQALLAIFRLSRSGAHGSVSASIENGVLHLRVLQEGAATWNWSASPMTAALWIAGPPIALWLAWMIARSQQARTGPIAQPLASDDPRLPQPGLDPFAERMTREGNPLERREPAQRPPSDA